jgi:hypothetical protein
MPRRRLAHQASVAALIAAVSLHAQRVQDFADRLGVQPCQHKWTAFRTLVPRKPTPGSVKSIHLMTAPHPNLEWGRTHRPGFSQMSEREQESQMSKPARCAQNGTIRRALRASCMTRQDRDSKTDLKGDHAPLRRFDKVWFRLPRRSPHFFRARRLGFISRKGDVSCKSS